MTVLYKWAAAALVLLWALGASWLLWEQVQVTHVAQARFDALEARVAKAEKLGAKQARARVAAAESVREQRTQNEKERTDAPRIYLPAPELERLRKLTERANSGIMPGASPAASAP